MDEEFAQLQKANLLNQRTAVRHWLNGARVEEDYEANSKDRNQYPGVCRWIFKEKNFQLWKDFKSTTNPLLWITGMPGAGNSSTDRRVRMNANFAR
jgi:hypothetical protein